MTSESSRTPITTALVAAVIVLWGPTVAAASDFSGMGWKTDGVILVVTVVSVVSLIISFIVTMILWMKTRRWWVWLALPVGVVACTVGILGTLIAYFV